MNSIRPGENPAENEKGVAMTLRKKSVSGLALWSKHRSVADIERSLKNICGGAEPTQYKLGIIPARKKLRPALTAL